MKLDTFDGMAFTSPMAEAAQILAAGFLRLRRGQVNGSFCAPEVSEKTLDLCAGKSVHCDTPARGPKSRRISGGGAGG